MAYYVDSNIKQLWEMHTEAQEQILRSHAVPISILPESAKVTSNGKVVVTADEISKVDLLLEEMAVNFGLDADVIANEKGYFFVDKDKIPALDVRELLSSEAEHCHIKFRPLPVIDGTLSSNDELMKSFTSLLLSSSYDYSFDRKGRLQIAISNLEGLKSQFLENNNLNLIVPDKATAIFPLQPSPIFFLNKEFPRIEWKHHTRVIKSDRDQELKFLRTISVEDGYIPSDLLGQLNDRFGLKLYEYQMEFGIPEEILNSVTINPDIMLPKFDKAANAFVVKIKVKVKNHSKNTDSSEQDDDREFASDINYNYTFYKRILERYYGNGNVTLKHTLVFYKYDIEDYAESFLSSDDSWKDEFWESIYLAFSDSDVSVSLQSESIGIDFNWRKDSMKDILFALCEKIPNSIISYYPKHKCNIDLKIQDTSLDVAEETLRENFPSIQISRNDWDGNLYFFQEYNEAHQYERIYSNLKRQMDDLELYNYTITLNEVPTGKEKFIFKFDKNSHRESQIEVIQSMRGKDFTIMDGIKLGRLIRISYPLLTFALDDTDKDRAIGALDAHIVKYVLPDITGDLEKIHRLKNALSSIIHGKGLHNPNLSDFIFDASQAKPIDNIEYYTNESSEYYRELTSHLLNSRINDSQKKAIIKTLLAEDLALIQGPPGTGKSTAIAEIIWQHIRRNSSERVLLTSETNLAVDNAIDRIVNKSHNLVKPIRIGDDTKLVSEGRQFSLDAMKLWVQYGYVKPAKRGYTEEDDGSTESAADSQKIILENWTQNILRRADIERIGIDSYDRWNHYLSHPDKTTRELLFSQYIRNCNVIGATCSSIGDKNTKGAPTGFFRYYCELFGKVEEKTNREGKAFKIYSGKIHFDTVIQDESSKATPAELSLPLIYGKKNIIIGDHRQLPPLLDKEEFMSSLEYLLRDIEDADEKRRIQRLKSYVDSHFDNMEVSHFQRLFENIAPSLKGVFNQQYRMHWAINDVIAQFYEEDGGLTCGLDRTYAEDADVSNPNSRYHGIDINGFVRPNDHIIWLDTDSPEIHDGTSRVNYGEVDAVRAILNVFQKSDSFRRYQELWNRLEDKQIGLISFYGKQIKQLWQLSKEYPEIPLEVNTVDKFQGMERNIIIVSMVRSSCITADKEQRPDYQLYGPSGYPRQDSLGFAQSPNRLNVALSRAKRLLIIVGNSELFRNKQIYDNVYRTIANSDCGNIIKCDSEWIGKRL